MTNLESVRAYRARINASPVLRARALRLARQQYIIRKYILQDRADTARLIHSFLEPHTPSPYNHPITI